MANTPPEPSLTRKTTQLSHPSGRLIHIASNPENAEVLRRELTHTYGKDGFEIYMKGSEEHKKALEEAHSHHEQRRIELRRENPEAWNEFEKVHRELDTLSSELQNLTTQSVALDANFGRFGYSATIKTMADDGDSASVLSRTTSGGSQSGERTLGEAIKLYRRPVVRQYFHKGLIWRASEETEVSALELFIDLIFVGLIAVNGDTAADEPTGESFLRFSITLIMAYQLWTCATSVNSWFVSNDLFQRFCIVFFMATLVGFTTNIQEAFDSTYTELVAFYLAGRLFQVAYYALLYFLIPMLRFFLIGASIIILIPTALWIGSVHVDYPNRLGFIFIALVLDLYGNFFVMVFFHSPKLVSKIPLFKNLLGRADFYPAVNIEHRTERMNAFVTLVIGYSVVSLLYQSNAPDGINAFYGKAVLGLVIAVIFSLTYFELDSSNLHVHAIRRSGWSYSLWQNIHLPFVLSFTLASAALARLVVARDCPDTPFEALADTFATKSSEELEPGLRWFFCGGLGVALACNVLISLSHDHKQLPGLRVSKRIRMLVRSFCSVVIIVLPTAGDRLNSLDLIATVAGVLFVSLFIELWGCSDTAKGSFWADKRCCEYATECKLSKKDLEALRNGEVTGVEELAKKRRQDRRKDAHTSEIV